MDYLEFIDYQLEYLPFGEPPITADQIWYFEINQEWRFELLKSARFYVESIRHNSIYLTVPCRVVFSVNYSINAAATVFHERGLIVWSGGLLLKQLGILNRWQDIDQAINGTQLENILQSLDNHPSILFFQTVQHFTFYHEFGHIIQIQEKETGLITLPTQNGYNLTRHVLEVDADEFSALFLASHFLQYADKQLDLIDSSSLALLLAFFMVPILSFSISLYPENVQDIDLNHETHPHPIFRTLFITMVITEFVNQRHDGDIVLDSREILDITISVVSRLINVDLVTIWSNHYDELVAYFRQIRNKEFPEGYKSAVDAWNDEILGRNS